MTADTQNVSSGEKAAKGRAPGEKKYRRGEKSLSQLSARFLANLWTQRDKIVNLDDTTRVLEIERRRLYDIINILEGLGLIFRVSKSSFMWKGILAAIQNIKQVISKLTASLRTNSKSSLRKSSIILFK